MRIALSARVNTSEQTTANQRLDLRQYYAARGWQHVVERVDTGISGSKDSRTALDNLVRDAKRRRSDALGVWELDRLGRSLRHLMLLFHELAAPGVAFVRSSEGIDTTTRAGRLQP
jgi:DNA invertase Pin-like site-specific DNA recombinase